MLSSQRPRPNPEVRFEPFDGEILLYSPRNAAGIWLNATASLVWGLCDGRRTIGEIVDVLRGTYPAAADQLSADVEGALGELAALGAIDLE